MLTRERIEEVLADAVERGQITARDAQGLGSDLLSRGKSFPISGYDDLNVGEVRARLGGLTPAELRKVRDYERRHANRKTVLAAIEAKLP